MKRKGLSHTRHSTQSPLLLTIVIPRSFCRDVVRQTRTVQTFATMSEIAGSLKPIGIFYHWQIIAMETWHVFFGWCCRGSIPKVLNQRKIGLGTLETQRFEFGPIWLHDKTSWLNSQQERFWSTKPRTTLSPKPVGVNGAGSRCCVRDPGRWSHCILEFSWYSQQPQKPHGWINFYLRKQDA